MDQFMTELQGSIGILKNPDVVGYLLGGLAGGFLGGKLFTKVPAVWLRRLFAAFLVYGGVRYLL